ncbi:putative anti-repressor protein [Corynebacterium renale]|nr:putative anti-repressor protein [Corynebacterium renale]
MRVIGEPDLYRLIVGSDLETAQEFERVVFEEVLPSIRKHGGYLTPSKLEDVLLNPDTLIQLAQNLKAEQEKSKALAAKIERDRPKTVFADAVATSSSTILVGDLAKILRGNGVDIGANRLFAWLRDNKFLISRRGQDWNMPTQRSMDLGLFQIKETAVTHADGHVTVSKTPKVTGKGQRYFIDKFLGQESSYDGQLELTHT